MEIVIKEHIGDRATDMDQGNIICALIKDAFSNNQDVTLNFADMATVLSAFLNTAVGSLYQNYSSEYLNSHLRIVNLCADDMFLLRRVNRRAKEFYANREAITKNLDASFSE